MSNMLSVMVALSVVAAIAVGCEEPDTPSVNAEPQTVAVTGVTLNKTSISLIEGDTETLTATIAPSDATNKEVSWKSSDATIATVDNSGKVTAVKAGNCKIYAESLADKTKQAICEVTVTPDLTLKGISFPYASITMKRNETKQLQVVFNPEYAENKNVTWDSYDPSVATITADGMVTAVWNGEADIIATSQEGGFFATCQIIVSSGEGAEVYVRTTSGFFLNGEEFQAMNEHLEQIYYDGTDLYECYLYDGIFRNGFKIVDLHGSGDLVAVTAGKLYYFDYDCIYFYDLKTGKCLYRTSLSDKPSYRNEAMAVAPDGTIYVVGYSMDDSNRKVGRLWTFSKDFKLTETTLYSGGLEELGYDVALDEEGNVWALTLGDNLNLYKNGEFFRVVREGRGGNDFFLSFCGEDLYIVADNDDSTIDVYKNENLLYNISTDDSIKVSTKPLFSEDGDLYIGASGSSSINKSYIFKNGKLLYSVDGWHLYEMTVVNLNQ